MSPASILSDPSYPALKRYVLEHTGLAYYVDKDEDLASRLSRRLNARQSRSTAAYLTLLSRDPAEMDCLVGELTIGETYFFRQPEHFSLLRSTIVPDLMERKRNSRSLRIWSAGCATGAEPYYLAILLALDFAAQLADWDVSILATDINTDFIAQASEARFGDWALRETPPDIKSACFRREGRKWSLLPEFRKRVAFRYHNLATGVHPSADKLPFDLIVCRNVLIYFSQNLIREVAARLYDNLETGGWLLVGHAEPNPNTFGIFEPVTTPIGTVYRKGAARRIAANDWLRTLGFENLQLDPPSAFLPTDLPLAMAPQPPLPQLATGPVKSETLPVEAIRLLADTGQWDAAFEAADRLVSKDPLDASAHFTLGLILEHSGSSQAACSALKRAIYLDRGLVMAHYHLATALNFTGDAKGARRSFTAVIRILEGLSPAEPLPHGDGITAQELRDLAKMHLELIAE